MARRPGAERIDPRAAEVGYDALRTLGAALLLTLALGCEQKSPLPDGPGIGTNAEPPIGAPIAEPGIAHDPGTLGTAGAPGSSGASQGSDGATQGSAGATAPAGGADIGLPPPEHGFQLANEGAELQPGQEAAWCEVLTLPGTADVVHAVSRLDIAMTEGSHHFVIAAIAPGTELTLADGGERRSCDELYSTLSGSVERLFGAQTPQKTIQFPAGVGLMFTGGQRLIFDAHAVNTTSSPLLVRQAVNFDTVDPAEIQRVARRFSFSDPLIQVPAGGRASVEAECRFSHELLVGSLTRHTHALGTDFSVWRAGGLNDGELVWTSQSYELDVDHDLADPVLVQADEGFRFRCDYENPGDNLVVYGPASTNEMCLLLGFFWASEVGDSVPDQRCSASVVGSDGIARPAG